MLVLKQEDRFPLMMALRTRLNEEGVVVPEIMPVPDQPLLQTLTTGLILDVFTTIHFLEIFGSDLKDYTEDQYMALAYTLGNVVKHSVVEAFEKIKQEAG